MALEVLLLLLLLLIFWAMMIIWVKADRIGSVRTSRHKSNTSNCAPGEEEVVEEEGGSRTDTIQVLKEDYYYGGKQSI